MRVPEGWSIKSISDVGNVITGSTPSTTHSEYYGGEIPFISPADLGVRKFISTSTKTLTDTGFNCTRKIRKGATLFTCIGSTIGKIGLSNVDLATNQQINAVVPHDNYDDEYVYYALSNRAIQIAKIAGNQAVPIINKSTFAAQLLLTPPLPEQQKIAQILSTWDKAINTTEQLLANSQHQKKALMQQLLTGKKRLLDEDGVRFSGERPEYLLEKIEKLGWAELGRGNVISKKDMEDIPGEYPIYSSSVKNNGLMGAYGDFMFEEELISWSVDGGGNFFYRPKHKFSITNVSGYIRLDTNKLDYQFIAAQLEFLHSKLKFDYQTKAHPSVIRKMYILAIPTLEEQTKIATVLSTADREIELLQTKLEALKQEKKALMQQLLTGKRRVNFKGGNDE